MSAQRNYIPNSREHYSTNPEVESLLTQIPETMSELKTLVRARVALMTPQKRTVFVPILQEEVERILSGQSGVEIKITRILNMFSEAANEASFQMSA